MTEQVPPEPTEASEVEPESTRRPGDGTTTGVPGVDRVLAEVDDLDDLPLEEHLSAFERAHGSLRAALDAEPETVPDDPA